MSCTRCEELRARLRQAWQRQAYMTAASIAAQGAREALLGQKGESNGHVQEPDERVGKGD